MVELNQNSRIKLNSLTEMPIFGLGMYLMEPGEISLNSVYYALTEQVYRHFDTAEYYHNQADLGNALKLAKIPREKIFITSKIFQTKDGRDTLLKTFHKCLEDLDTTYIDQYLLHAPQGGRVLECYDTLLDLQRQGLIKSVGVSNFGVKHLEAIKKANRPLPDVNQIELHPWCLNEDIVDYCREANIAVVGYSPLTKARRLDDANLVDLANKYNKTPAQVLIRWSLQKGFVTIPKSKVKEHIKENIDVFNFSLSDEDMLKLDAFGKNGGKQVTGWDPTLNPMSEFGPEI